MFATDAMNTDLVHNEHTEIETVEISDDDDDDKNEELMEICSEEESEDGSIIEW